MTEIRETLRFGSTDLEEMNRVMGRLMDRLDALEGLRGDPAFHSDVDFTDKRLLNVSGMAHEATPANPSSAAADETVFDLPTIFQSTVDVTGAVTLKGSADIAGTLTANGEAIFNGAATFNSAIAFSSSPSGIVTTLTIFSQAGPLTASDIGDGGIALWDDLGGNFYLCANFGGSIKKTALT